MERCRAFDELIYDDAEKAGGKKYAEICSASYRQVISAHKLFTDKEVTCYGSLKKTTVMVV
ncbi:DUF4965 domain-containing protein [Bacteroides thetaiotaomicron]|uniref:DUF4965 domain-containing protein n=1 Tax=Bacteroides thetaiotaomicron TaxID=818 RepID=UPI001F5C03C1|nr:DUF4965 domain-containing protein [Bacteroides thetaiotaomicron]